MKESACAGTRRITASKSVLGGAAAPGEIPQMLDTQNYAHVLCVPHDDYLATGSDTGLLITIVFVCARACVCTCVCVCVCICDRIGTVVPPSVRYLAVVTQR